MCAAASTTLQEQQFLTAVQQAIATNQFERLVLSQYQGERVDLEKISMRLIALQKRPVIQCVFKYKTQDITQNFELDQVIIEIEQLLSQSKQANLWTTQEELQLKKTKKKVLLTQHKTQSSAVQASKTSHDREKNRMLDQNSPYLQYLGICDAQAQLIPSMARKWKQINKFVEIFSNALSQIPTSDKSLNIVDFGSGKGYLTFALYDYLLQQQQTPSVTGVELNDQMVQFCQKVAEKSEFTQLEFFQGDVRSYQPEHLDVMIALHACDIATDFAIHTGIRLNASVIMCAPCCHKQLRPQMQSPMLLQPMLQFGIHAGQQAEMLTDTIRALLLKAYGYESKVFEFVALEHTSKNKMILATKRRAITEPDPVVLEQIKALKQHYAIKDHALEQLLNDQWEQHDLGKKC